MTFDTFEYVSSILEHFDFPMGNMGISFNGDFFQRGFPQWGFVPAKYLSYEEVIQWQNSYSHLYLYMRVW